MFSTSLERMLDIQKKRSQREDNIKLKVLNTLKDKLQTYANFGKLNCIYTVPNFVIGHCLYQLDDMMKYIIKKLKSEGYSVKQLSTQHILISWDIKEITNNLNKQSKSKSKSKSKSVDTDEIDYSAFINNSKGY